MTEREQILLAIAANLQSDPRLEDVPIHCPPLSSYTVQGQNWPETIGDLTLMGPANRLGAWRWYQRHNEKDGAQIDWRIKLNYHLQPLWDSAVTTVTPAPNA